MQNNYTRFTEPRQRVPKMMHSSSSAIGACHIHFKLFIGFFERIVHTLCQVTTIPS